MIPLIILLYEKSAVSWRFSSLCWILPNVLHPIGYYNARTPGPVYISTINALNAFLNEIDTKLKEGAISNIEQIDKFSNSSYLRNELKDDILAKMNDVVIFREFNHLPSAGRYDITFDDPNNPTNWWLTEKQVRDRLCYWNPPEANVGCTPWMRDQTGRLHRDWIGLCYRPPMNPVGTPTTLLHELYHYAVREDQIIWDNVFVKVENYQTHEPMTLRIEDAKAYVISQGCNLSN